MQLQIGDRFSDEAGEWEVIAHPYATVGGKKYARASPASRQAWGNGGADVGVLREGHSDPASILTEGQGIMWLLRARTAEGSVGGANGRGGAQSMMGP